MANLNEHILEIRYKPNPKILDYRGTWAEGISGHMGLKHWNIVQNRVDVYNEDSSLQAFVSFKNAGFVALDTQTRDFFPNKALRFFKYLFSMDGFGKELFVERLGVRSTFVQEFKGEFDELLNKYKTNYLSLTEKASKVIDAELVDIGGPLNFKDKNGNFNTMSGPMKSEQLSGYFGRSSDKLPDVSLYYDIDSWIRPKKDLTDREILRKIKAFTEASWDRFINIRDVILGE